MASAKEEIPKVMQKETSQQHHQKAAEHHKYASEHHKEAVRHHKSGDQKAAAHDDKAEAYHVRIAHEHTVQASGQEAEESKLVGMRSLKKQFEP